MPSSTIMDMVNDRHYLDAIKQEFEKYQDELAQRRDHVEADI